MATAKFYHFRPKIFSNLKVLKNPHYRAYFISQFISMTGMWTQSVAQSWLVYRMTHSGYWLGVINFCTHLPAFLTCPFAGVYVDQGSRRKILLIVQVLSMIQSILLAGLVFTGHVAVWHVVVLSFALGVVTSFDMTARHAFTVDMVGKQDLPNAITLNSVLMNAARILGPTVAGFLISFAGEAWCFSLDAVSYIPIIWLLFTMRLHSSSKHPKNGTVTEDMLAGFKYVWNHKPIRNILIATSFICFFACSYGVLMPIFAKKILQGDAHLLAWLTGIMGIGAVVGSLTLNAGYRASSVRRELTQNVIFWAASLIGLGLSNSKPFSLLAMFGVGFFMMRFFPTVNNELQQSVEDSMRGRVMSFYTMTFLGTVPFGSLAAGWLSDRFGAPIVAISGGVATILCGFLFWIPAPSQTVLKS